MQCQRKNNTKELEGTILETHTGLEIVCVSSSQSGKTSKFTVVRLNNQKGVISAGEKISLKGCSDSK